MKMTKQLYLSYFLLNMFYVLFVSCSGESSDGSHNILANTSLIDTSSRIAEFGKDTIPSLENHNNIDRRIPIPKVTHEESYDNLRPSNGTYIHTPKNQIPRYKRFQTDFIYPTRTFYRTKNPDNRVTDRIIPSISKHSSKTGSQNIVDMISSESINNSPSLPILADDRSLTFSPIQTTYSDKTINPRISSIQVSNVYQSTQDNPICIESSKKSILGSTSHITAISSDSDLQNHLILPQHPNTLSSQNLPPTFISPNHSIPPRYPNSQQNRFNPSPANPKHFIPPRYPNPQQNRFTLIPLIPYFNHFPPTYPLQQNIFAPIASNPCFNYFPPRYPNPQQNRFNPSPVNPKHSIPPRHPNPQQNRFDPSPANLKHSIPPRYPNPQQNRFDPSPANLKHSIPPRYPNSQQNRFNLSPANPKHSIPPRYPNP